MANTLQRDPLSAAPEGFATLLVCEGKDCAKKQSCAYAKLLKAAKTADVGVQLIGCQGSCTGPTAVLIGADGPRWFEDLKKPKAQADVIALAQGAIAKPTKRLKKRELRGTQRKRAKKKLAKSLLRKG